MTSIYYILVLLMWVMLYFMVRHTCNVVNDYGCRNRVCTRTIRAAQFTGILGLLVIGTGTTYAAHIVYTLHVLSVSGIH